jgi:transposase
VDEKSQIQALERSQPLLPLRPGLPERQTHDYFRHGTVSLFAALDVATGEVYAQCHQRRTHREFLDFLRQLEAEVPAGLEVHLVMDNYAAHKTRAVRRWFARHDRWHVHFIPTHSSWLNQVERFFAQITTERIGRGSYRSVAELRHAILSYIDRHNNAAHPFQWKASADLILGKVQAICGSSQEVCFEGEWRGPQPPRRLGVCPTGPREEGPHLLGAVG